MKEKNNTIIINGYEYLVTDEVYNKLVRTMRAKANQDGIQRVPKTTKTTNTKPTATVKQTAKQTTTKTKPKAKAKSGEWTKEQYEEYRQLAKDYGVWSERRHQPWKHCKPVLAKVINGEITMAQFKKELNSVVNEYYSETK